MKPGWKFYKAMVAVLDRIGRISARRVIRLAGALLVVLWLGRVFDVDRLVERTMATLLALFAVAIVANACAIYVACRGGFRVGRIANGRRAYRSWRRVQSRRSLPARA